MFTSDDIPVKISKKAYDLRKPVLSQEDYAAVVAHALPEILTEIATYVSKMDAPMFDPARGVPYQEGWDSAVSSAEDAILSWSPGKEKP